MEYLGLSQAYAKDRLPTGMFQICQNMDRSVKGKITVRKGLSDTGIADTGDEKRACYCYRDKRGEIHFVTLEGAALAGTMIAEDATNPVWS